MALWKRHLTQAMIDNIFLQTPLLPHTCFIIYFHFGVIYFQGHLSVGKMTPKVMDRFELHFLGNVCSRTRNNGLHFGVDPIWGMYPSTNQQCYLILLSQLRELTDGWAHAAAPLLAGPYAQQNHRACATLPPLCWKSTNNSSNTGHFLINRHFISKDQAYRD